MHMMMLPWSKAFYILFYHVFTRSIFYTHGPNFRQTVWSLSGFFALRPCTHLLLISWSVNQGKKLRWKTNQPPGRKIPAKHLWVTALFLSFPLSFSLAPLCSCQPPPFMWETCFSDLLPAMRGPGRTWAISVPRGPCTVKLSQGHLASYPASTHSRSTMHIWRKFIHYVMPSLIIYPPLSFH